MKSKKLYKNCKVELKNSTVRILILASEEDRDLAKKLPYIFSLEGDYMLLGEIPHMYTDNAKDTYNSIKTSKQATEILYNLI